MVTVTAVVAVAVAAAVATATTTVTATANANAVVVTVVVATDKHITLLFKTRSGIKHTAKRCSDVSPRSAFCFSRLFLTTHALLLLTLWRNVSSLLLFLLSFFPSSSLRAVLGPSLSLC